MNKPHTDRLLAAAAGLALVITAAQPSRADRSCSVSFDVSGAVDLGSADVRVSFDPADLDMTGCFEIGVLAVNNHQHASGSFSAEVLCSPATDPPCTQAVSGTSPLLTCCLVAAAEPEAGDFTPALTNVRTLTGQPAVAGVVVSDLSCGMGNPCCCLTTTTLSSTTTSTVGGGGPTCGDANGDGNVTATDALIALSAAIGATSCPAAVCDVDAVSGVTATDALILLKHAVGQQVDLVCAPA